MIEVRSDLMQDSSPPRQRLEISGGVRIEAIESDGSKWRIEADLAIIESGAGVNEKFEFTSGSDVTRIVCSGSVKLDAGRGDESTRLTGENLEIDVRGNYGWLNQSRIQP